MGCGPSALAGWPASESGSPEGAGGRGGFGRRSPKRRGSRLKASAAAGVLDGPPPPPSEAQGSPEGRPGPPGRALWTDYDGGPDAPKRSASREIYTGPITESTGPPSFSPVLSGTGTSRGDLR